MRQPFIQLANTFRNRKRQSWCDLGIEIRISQEMCFHNVVQCSCFLFGVLHQLFFELLITLYMALSSNLANASTISRSLELNIVHCFLKDCSCSLTFIDSILGCKIVLVKCINSLLRMLEIATCELHWTFVSLSMLRFTNNMHDVMINEKNDQGCND